jgi:hypothetical protein
MKVLQKIIKTLTLHFIIVKIIEFTLSLFKAKKVEEQPTQMRFNSQKDIFKGHEEVNILNWDLPDVNTFGIDSSKTTDKSTSTTRRISNSFNKFTNLDVLKLTTKCGIIIEYNLNESSFKINGKYTRANIENVMGLSQVGNSRIDGKPIIAIKIKGSSKALILKVIEDESRFQSIADLDDNLISKSNIDSIDSMSYAISGAIVNGKYRR